MAKKPKYTMTVSCLPDGTVQHTLKDKFFRPFPESNRNIERMTDIRFDENAQTFYIVFLKGPWVGERMTNAHLFQPEAIILKKNLNKGKTIYYMNFPLYDEAVAAEVECINKLRNLGVMINANEVRGLEKQKA